MPVKSVNGVEGKFFVLLHILIIGEGEALHGSEKGNQGSVDTAGLAANQFGDIRILFLRHNAGSCGVGIVDFHKAVLVGIPQDNLLAKTAHVHHNRGHGAEKFNQVIPV